MIPKVPTWAGEEISKGPREQSNPPYRGNSRARVEDIRFGLSRTKGVWRQEDAMRDAGIATPTDHRIVAQHLQILDLGTQSDK